MKPKLNDSDHAQVSEDLLDHDPTLRGEVHNDNQREYLVELGPCQLRLSCFPTNPDISPGKQIAIRHDGMTSIHIWNTV